MTNSNNHLKLVSEIDQLENDARAAAKINYEATKKDRREILLLSALTLCAPAAASGWLAWAKFPRIEQRTEFVPVDENGFPIKAYRDEDLPPEAKQDVIFASIYNYVWLRESFSSGMADHAWRVVTAMSTAEVSEEYKKFNDPNNPKSPWKTYGENGYVKINYDSHTNLTPPNGVAGPPQGYFIRFWRQEKLAGASATKPVMYGASLRFRRDEKDVTPRQIREFNPGAIKVWEYPGGQAVSNPTQVRKQ